MSRFLDIVCSGWRTVSRARHSDITRFPPCDTTTRHTVSLSTTLWVSLDVDYSISTMLPIERNFQFSTFFQKFGSPCNNRFDL